MVNIPGTPGDDRLTGTDGNDLIVGFEGADTIAAGNGEDRIYLMGNQTGTTVDGGSGRDMLLVAPTFSPLWGDFTIGDFAPIGVEYISVASRNNDTGEDIFAPIYGDGDTNDTDDHINFKGMTSLGLAFTPITTGVTVYAGEGADRVWGTHQNDTLYGEDGDDTLYGEKGNDRLFGGTGDDNLNGGDGDDMIVGGAGADVIDGGNGEDTVNAGAGDRVNGGTGRDTLNISLLTYDVIAPLMTAAGEYDKLKAYMADPRSAAFELESINFEASGFETVNLDFGPGRLLIDNSDPDGPLNSVPLNPGPLVMIGSENDDTMNGGRRNDIVFGQGGDDSLSGNDGNDSLNGGAGEDTLSGGSGHDMLDGGADKDHYDGGRNNDTFMIRDDEAMEDTFDGGSNWDKIQVAEDSGEVTFKGFSTQGVEMFDGSNESIQGTHDANTLNFSALRVMRNVEKINGLGGDDTIRGSRQDDTINGDGGNDLLVGNDGQDHLNGGEGDDNLYGGSGHDMLDGGAGKDHYHGGRNNDTFIIRNAEAMEDTFDGGSNWDKIQVADDSEEVTFNSFSTQGVEMFDGNDKVIQGTSAANTLDFSALRVMRNVDEINGLGGNDTIHGSRHNDTINGDGGNDLLVGNDGQDRLNGGEDDDSLYGGSGHDTLDGGAGKDHYYGGRNNDTFMIRDDEAMEDTFDGGSNWDKIQVAEGSGVVTFNSFSTQGVEMFDGNGQVIQGTSAANTLDFSALRLMRNVDEINGLGGNDTIYGSRHNDPIKGGSGNDTLRGNDGNDVLLGGFGIDSLDGGAGHDILNAGAGFDMMTGGRNNDTFQFVSKGGNNVNIITDFDSNGNDRLALDGFATDLTGGDFWTLANSGGRQGVIDHGDTHTFVNGDLSTHISVMKNSAGDLVISFDVPNSAPGSSIEGLTLNGVRDLGRDDFTDFG